MDDFDKFQSYILQEFRVITEPILEQHIEEFGETLWNDLFDLKGKRTIDRRQSEKEVFFGKVFRGYVEIHDSYSCLKDIQVYIGRFPYNKTGISKAACLIYHIINYMNEVYVLKERLSAYLKKIGRLYKNDHRHHEILQSTKPIFTIVHKTLGGIVQTRGSHVHVSRYKDNELKRLTTLELLAQNNGKDIVDEFPAFYESEYKKLRLKWKKLVKQSNETLRELFNIYFGALLKILFDKNGNLIYPQAIGHT